jgi:replicative DNA helicase
MIAARLSMGRTAWATHIAQNNATKDVAVFSVEM